MPDHVTLWGLRLKICQSLDQYANVRPARLLPGIKGPLRDVTAKQLDWVIVRENSEGEYAGAGGRVHQGLPEEVGLDISVFTPQRGRTDSTLRVRACKIASSQKADLGDQVECSTPWHGVLGFGV